MKSSSGAHALQHIATTGALGLLGAAAAVASFAASGCAPALPHVYGQEAVIRVESDPGVPLGDATVIFDGKTLTKTNAQGRAHLRMAGHDGDAFRLAVECPDGYQSGAPIELEVLVRRGEEKTRVPEFNARCARTVRRAVVAVRANNGANLPIAYLGREIGRTDASGAATFALDVKPGSDVELVIDTRAAKKIHPQNPVISFRAPDKDDLVVLDQTFTVDKPVVKRFVARGPSLPRALGGAAD